MEDPDLSLYRRVCATNEIIEHFPKVIELDDRTILLCKLGNSIFALDEMCPHKMRSMRAGMVVTGTLVCPHHRYPFRLDDGKCIGKKCAPVETYDVWVNDTDVYVKI